MAQQRLRSNFIITGLARTLACFSSFVANVSLSHDTRSLGRPIYPFWGIYLRSRAFCGICQNASDARQFDLRCR
jgi:hypothetical protein